MMAPQAQLARMEVGAAVRARQSRSALRSRLQGPPDPKQAGAFVGDVSWAEVSAARDIVARTIEFFIPNFFDECLCS